MTSLPAITAAADPTAAVGTIRAASAATAATAAEAALSITLRCRSLTTPPTAIGEALEGGAFCESLSPQLTPPPASPPSLPPLPPRGLAPYPGHCARFFFESMYDSYN